MLIKFLDGTEREIAYLRGAYLRGANLQGANLQGANLQGADLQRANLQGANLYGANLEGANLQGADLQRADLQRADLRGADLRGADLQGAYLNSRGPLEPNHPVHACVAAGACTEGVLWAAQLRADADIESALKMFGRANWLAWYLEHVK